MRGGLKVLTGEDLIAIFHRFGFVVVGGTKHLKLRRTTPTGQETLVIPYHDPVAKGTLRAIFSQASHYIPQSELHPHFYNE
jgi:HicA-like toxin of HicAB toxin-antitoxin system